MSDVSNPVDQALERPVDEPRDQPADQTADQTPGEAMAGSVAAGVPRRRRRIDKGLVAVSLVMAFGAVLVARGVLVGITGDDRSHMPAEVEDVSPVPEAVQVLSQSNIMVDLESGYTGVLVIDDVEIETIDIDELGSVGIEPGEQVDLPPATIYEPGNATLTFTPNADAPITELDTGEHRAQVIFWKIIDGRDHARSYTWTFDVV